MEKEYEMPKINIYEYSGKEEVATDTSGLDIFNGDNYNMGN